MRVTPASAQAAAWAKEKSSVMLQWMPSRSSFSAALMPSQVLASLIRTRSRLTPAFSYSEINRRAFSTERAVSNDRRASTSVETRPGDVLEDLAAEIHEDLVHVAVHQVPEARILGRGEQERGVGRGVLRLPARHRFDVAGVGDHQGVLPQGFELGHDNFFGGT